MAGNVYESIWETVAAHLSVTLPDENGEWTDPTTAVRLDEQGRVATCLDQGTAPRPLLSIPDEGIFGGATFETFIALLDNYTAAEGDPERLLTDPPHAAQVDAFLDAVLPTAPMQLAVDYVRRELFPGMTAAAFRDGVRNLWFEPFTNRFGAVEQFCVGFEHVFVGEDLAGASVPRCQDLVGGYHSWVAYYLDQRAGRAKYMGHDYEATVAPAGLADPRVATVIMTWAPPDGSGQGEREMGGELTPGRVNRSSLNHLHLEPAR